MTLKEMTARLRAGGYWQLVVRPRIERQERIVNFSNIWLSLRDLAVNARGWDYPHVSLHDPPGFEQNAVWQTSDWNYFVEAWCVWKSGQFLHVAGMRSDYGATDQGAVGETLVAGEPLVGMGDSIFRFSEMFLFAARYLDAFAQGEGGTMHIEVGGLRGRRLFVDDYSRLAFSERHIATTEHPFVATREIEPAEAQDSLIVRARQTCAEFFQLFGGVAMSDEVMEGWQGKIRLKR